MRKVKWMKSDRNKKKIKCLLFEIPRKTFIFDRSCFPSTSIGKAALADRYDGGRNAPRSAHAVYKEM